MVYESLIDESLVVPSPGGIDDAPEIIEDRIV